MVRTAERANASFAFRRRPPGYLTTSLISLTSTLWTFWGVGEMFYDGWWGAWYNRLPYLGLPALSMACTLVALTWPRLGGWVIFAAGGTFTAWRWSKQAQLGTLTVEWMLGWFPISGLLVVVGLLFLLEWRHRQRRRTAGWTPPERWLRLNLRYIVAFAPPVLTAVIVTAYFVPFLLSHCDDGDRSVQRIEGNGVTLIWAPQGPGWNWHPLSGRGRRPSWDDLALFGMPPVGIHQERKGGSRGPHATVEDMEATGLCSHLDRDGTILMPERQEIVYASVHHL